MKVDKMTCPYCGEETDDLFECNECERKGCIKCMPRAMDADCPQCYPEQYP